MRPRHASTASTARTVGSILPECPTISAFAKFITITSKSFLPMASSTTFGDALRAHLRLQIVSRDLRRRHHLALFAGERLLDAAVEEVSHVRVLLGLGDAQVLPVQLREDVGRGCCRAAPCVSMNGTVNDLSYCVIVANFRFFGTAVRDGRSSVALVSASVISRPRSARIVEEDAGIVVANQADRLVAAHRRSSPAR